MKKVELVFYTVSYSFHCFHFSQKRVYDFTLWKAWINVIYLGLYFKICLKIFKILTGKHLYRIIFWIKLQARRCISLKLFKNNCFHRTPPVAASVIFKWITLYSVFRNHSIFQLIVWLGVEIQFLEKYIYFH